MNYQTFLDWIYNLFKGLSGITSWLVTPISIGTLEIAPLYLISVGGLTAYVSIAIILWVAR